MGGGWSIVALVAWVVAALLALLGLVLLLLGFFRDKHKGKRRCPSCWYDMAGVPGLTCPECGKDATKETGLFKRRRSKWKISLGVTALALSVGVALWPKVARDGWWTVTPTIALIWMWPDVPEWASPPPPTPGPGGAARQTFPAPGGGTQVVFGFGPVPGEAKAGVEALLSRRLRDWERAALVRRCATVLDTSTDPRDRLVLLGWLRQMPTRDIIPALPALARAAAKEGTIATPPQVSLGATGVPRVGGGTVLVPRLPPVLYGGAFRPLIREVAEVCTEMDSVVAKADTVGADAERVARMAWALATALPEDDTQVVGPLATFTLDDPLLLPDAIVQRMLKDDQSRGRILKAIAQSMDNYMESTDRCERLLIAAGPEAKAAIPELLGMASQHADRAGRTLSRAGFRVLAAIGSAGLPEAEVTLESWVESDREEGIGYLALWAGATLASMREDVPLLVRTLSEALDPSRDWDVRHEALAMLHARTPSDGLINARVLMAAEHESTLLQLGAVEALGRLSLSQPGLRKHLERLARQGKPRAREVAAEFLARVGGGGGG